MLVLNTCCFKMKDKKYLVIHKTKDSKDFKYCTDMSNNKINTTLIDRGHAKCIELNDDAPSCINIITENKTYENITLHFPFENAFPRFKNDSNINIISTMCRKYNFRLDEWIKYHLNIGLDGILIFDNTNNGGATNNCNDEDDGESMHLVTDKYGDKVTVIDFPYNYLGGHWNNIQSLTLFTGLHAMKHRCKYMIFTDADEFITVENNNLKEFCGSHDTTIQLVTTYLTNKSNDDLIDNNILSICKYKAGPSPLKMMVRTCEFLSRDDGFFMFYNPHAIYGHNYRVRNIHLYHCWVNQRFKYDSNMEYIDLKD